MFNLTKLFIFFQFLVQFVCRENFEKISEISNEKLIFAHTLCRSGDRNKISSYPNDMYKSEENRIGGYGQLTNFGKRQQYELGRYFRERYASLIGNGEYSPKKVYIESTDVNRVLMSADANLAGLFPPAGQQIWKSNLNWQPIPVHTTPLEEDHRLALSLFGCDQYVVSFLKYSNATDYQQRFNQHKTLISYLEMKTGMNISSQIDINDLYDTLTVEKLHGKRLPAWAEIVTILGGEFEQFAMSSYELISATPELKKFTSGFLLKEIFDRFTNKVRSTLSPDRSLWMYFAHDYTIATMLNSLGFNVTHQPPFASCLLYELYEGDLKPYVQIFYKNSTETNIPALDIPECGPKCSLDDMYNIYRDILPTQSYKDECELRDDESLPKSVIEEILEKLGNGSFIRTK